ncbi:MAG: HAMP domain-containing histidine kinase [Gammaproteobacteria bacterium]|nr:HAMP domain-containing histidine kinase [Gammaproteobacteria bacterium]MCP4090103.1 HAMP domain-containing histidine kinase [Gammaproteobacteria bacterium]MCP4277007.1 HAMP domain-containing histidine kinase [Gammaproteobacteria bacterium]MCP4832770.1 HAMP domain-containing histidine kinase [Gammaproteobacteria bacterium]MCP4929963.1 HAMP domain-containing histidine kinase [Gammaproteobacteria bacterium]
MNMLRRVLKVVGHSLTARLLLIFFVASMAYWQASVYAFTLFQDTDYLRRIAGAHIALHTDYILKDIGSPPDITRAKAIVARIPVDIRIVGPDMDWSSTSDFYLPEEIPFGPLRWLELSAASRSGVENWASGLDKVKFARHKEHTLLKIKDGDYDIIFASPRISEMPVENNASLIISLLGVAVLLLCYLAVRWVFQPIRWMQDGAARIGKGDLDYRIPTPRHDELGDLSRDINAMAEDVQGMLEAKRQLMLAISHELRSPLTRSKVALAMLDDAVTRESLLEDIDEMERLITDLLESEALNTRHAILRRETVNLAELIESVVSIDFGHRDQMINLDIAPDLPEAELDVTRIRLLLRNLIDNALRFNPADALPITVSLQSNANGLEIAVKDNGPGIPPEHLAHVTEPFYRADPARSRATGGVGLGLYLCRRIVEAHDGTLVIESNSESGTRISAQLPL